MGRLGLGVPHPTRGSFGDSAWKGVWEEHTWVGTQLGSPLLGAVSCYSTWLFLDLQNGARRPAVKLWEPSGNAEMRCRRSLPWVPST